MLESFEQDLRGPPGHHCVFSEHAIHVLVAEFQERLDSENRVMTNFELSNIRRELQAAIDALANEPIGEQTGANRARNKAVDHVKTALLFLTGSSTASIRSHPEGSIHTDDTPKT